MNKLDNYLVNRNYLTDALNILLEKKPTIEEFRQQVDKLSYSNFYVCLSNVNGKALMRVSNVDKHRINIIVIDATELREGSTLHFSNGIVKSYFIG